MDQCAFPVVWAAEGDAEAAVGEATLVGDRVVLTRTASGSGIASYEFGAADVEAVVVSRRADLLLHLRVRDRGWLRVSSYSAVLLFEMAQLFS